MGWRNTKTSWGLGAKLFHWIMALGIIGASIFVLHVNGSMPWFASSPLFFITYIHWHKAFGLILLALVILRLLWKWTNPKPVTDELTPFEEKASKWTHRSLYTLMLVVPVTGWIASSAFGSPTKFFGLFVIPGIIEKSKPLVGPFYWLHFGLAWLLLTIVSLHIIAAFYHHDRRKDNVLRAMWLRTKDAETERTK
jgi:cytochrome b561